MIKVDVKLPIKYNSEDLCNSIRCVLPISLDEIKDARILKRTLKISDESGAYYSATVAFSASEEKERGLLKMRKKVSEYQPFSYTPPAFLGNFRPVVVGAGPAGLFCALTLAEAGAAPIVLERGLEVSERGKKIKLFEQLGLLDTECNVQFGEGGAGTYSDGKLKVGAMDKYKWKVISEFIDSGATDDIAFSTTAHLGTDRLSLIVADIRRKIISLGGEFVFSARFSNLHFTNNVLDNITYIKNGEEHCIETRAVVLATGHSARDTIRMLYEKGLGMSAKGFGVGVRIEHPREYINKIVYRDSIGEIEDTASYHLVTHLKNGRSVYSFCMCPGGSVVAATGSEGCVVTNGMSEFDRMADNSNAAILVSVTPEDFGSEHPLAGFRFQEGIERRAYSLTEKYMAPAERLSDFLSGGDAGIYGSVSPSYQRGVEAVKCSAYLPDYILGSLSASFVDFDDWMQGFHYPDAILTGPETRTTSPVRIHRDERFMAVGFTGVFPAGEGAGYAGGIVSSATDGIRTAEKLILNMK